MPELSTTVYEFGPYRVDPLGRSLQRRGEAISLPPKAVEVLLELVKRPGIVTGKQDLMEAVWPETFVEDANLNQMIFLLRQAFGDDYIATVPRRGYRFTAEVRTAQIPFRIESIAVLPLANLSGDTAQDYFADGITEALITELAKLTSLRVVSRTSVMRYRGTKDTIGQIARASGRGGIGDEVGRSATNHRPVDSRRHRPTLVGRNLRWRNRRNLRAAEQGCLRRRNRRAGTTQP
jgi:DNA-binding winged helix-turn-helix (wHTH) protein